MAPAVHSCLSDVPVHPRAADETDLLVRACGGVFVFVFVFFFGYITAGLDSDACHFLVASTPSMKNEELLDMHYK